MIKIPTPKSKAAEMVYIYLLGYLNDNGYMPTITEIHENLSKDGMGFSRQWAWMCLKELENQGRIKIVPRKHRGILLLTNAQKPPKSG